MISEAASMAAQLKNRSTCQNLPLVLLHCTDKATRAKTVTAAVCNLFTFCIIPSAEALGIIVREVSERERERERERQTETERERQRERQRDRATDRRK